MFTNFSLKARAVHYPEDRKLSFVFSRKTAIILLSSLILVPGIAWLQYLLYGLPVTAQVNNVAQASSVISGFPVWLRLTHWINFFFLVILIRSGLSILMDHPRLYWNHGCTPGTEWLKFTPIDVPKDKVWTAKEDARYISPLISLPGYRHTVGIARGWHFIHVPFFVLNGAVYVALLFFDDHWYRIVPNSWNIIPEAWNIFVHYATLNMPVEPNGFYQYNALQQLSYFSVIFILAPLAMLTGLCMSPAIENRFHYLPKFFGNRQGARSVHFLVMIAYLAFILVHIAMVCATGFTRNINHITIGTDNPSGNTGIYIFTCIVALTIVFCFYAHWVSWKKPRWVQKTNAFINGNLWERTINKLRPKSYFRKEDISPFFWPNGKLPDSETWKTLAQNKFVDYKLKVDGLVENAIELSLSEIMALEKEQNITMQHCIQGWSGIAEWGGLPISKLIEMVKPLPSAKTVVFYSFGEGLYGGSYYDTHTLENCLKPKSILAWEMNYERLPEIYGAPLRLRIENQLGYKLVKWIERIEFVASHESIGKGYGGKNEDDEYFDLIANT